MSFWHRYLIEVDCSAGQFKSAKLEDKEYNINVASFSKHCKKEINAQRFLHLLADNQLLIYVAYVVYPSIRYIEGSQSIPVLV